MEFNRCTDAAFSNFRVWEALGFTIAYAYQYSLSTQVKLYILLVVLIFSYLGYTWCELIISTDETEKVRQFKEEVNIPEQQTTDAPRISSDSINDDVQEAKPTPNIRKKNNAHPIINRNVSVLTTRSVVRSRAPTVVVNEAFEDGHEVARNL